jgi:hypothetical protein
MLLQALESLVDDYKYQMEIIKDKETQDRLEALEAKANALYSKLEDREITEIRIKEV